MKLFATPQYALAHDTNHTFADPGSARGSTTIVKRSYIEAHLPGHPGEREDLYPCPIAYLVKQEPDSTIHPHYHKIAQFQVFTGGSGRFGQLPIERCIVHFANAWTPYGPIVAGAAGVEYVVLRVRWGLGVGWMPQAREQLLKIADRQPRHRVYPAFDIERPSERGLHTLGDEADGLGAWCAGLDDGEQAPHIDPALGGGQFTVALRGSLENRDGVVLPALGIHFSSCDEPALQWRARGGPASMLCVRFPKEE